MTLGEKIDLKYKHPQRTTGEIIRAKIGGIDFDEKQYFGEDEQDWSEARDLPIRYARNNGKRRLVKEGTTPISQQDGEHITDEDGNWIPF